MASVVPRVGTTCARGCGGRGARDGHAARGLHAWCLSVVVLVYVFVDLAMVQGGVHEGVHEVVHDVEHGDRDARVEQRQLRAQRTRVSAGQVREHAGRGPARMAHLPDLPSHVGALGAIVEQIKDEEHRHPLVEPYERAVLRAQLIEVPAAPLDQGIRREEVAGRLAENEEAEPDCGGEERIVLRPPRRHVERRGGRQQPRQHPQQHHPLPACIPSRTTMRRCAAEVAKNVDDWHRARDAARCEE